MPTPDSQSSCPVCDSRQRQALPVACRWNSRLWNYVRCRDCGHQYTDAVPNDDELAMMYDDRYFRAGGAWVSGCWPGSYADNLENLRQEARETLAYLETRHGRLLEIGSAGGVFLDEARRAGFDGLGVELNSEMAAWGRSKLGVNIVCGPFEAVDLPPASFDVVVAMDVLEHVRDPRAVVHRVAKLLRPGGKFLVRGPLEESARVHLFNWSRQILRRGVRVADEPPFHLQGFVRRSFARLMQPHFEVEVLDASSARPRWLFTTPKESLAGLIGFVGYWVDLFSGAGDFMIARAVKVT